MKIALTDHDVCLPCFFLGHIEPEDGAISVPEGIENVDWLFEVSHIYGGHATYHAQGYGMIFPLTLSAGVDVRHLANILKTFGKLSYTTYGDYRKFTQSINLHYIQEIEKHAPELSGISKDLKVIYQDIPFSNGDYLSDQFFNSFQNLLQRFLELPGIDRDSSQEACLKFETSFAELLLNWYCVKRDEKQQLLPIQPFTKEMLEEMTALFADKPLTCFLLWQNSDLDLK